MKLLGLFRHAKSDWQDPRARDFDRQLNARGREGAAVMGRHIRDHGLHWDRIISSPAIRCAETIEIACQAAGRPVAVQWDRRIYLASSATLLDLLRAQDDSATAVLMVGHNPGLEDLIFDLVPDDGTSPLREHRSPQNESWNNRVRAYETVTRTGTNSCSAVGSGGWTGCQGQLINQAYGEKATDPSLKFAQMIADERAKRLATIDQDAAETQARVEEVERQMEARRKAQEAAGDKDPQDQKAAPLPGGN